MSKHEQNAVLKPGDDTQVFIPSGSVAATVVKVLHNGQVVFRIPPIDCIVAKRSESGECQWEQGWEEDAALMCHLALVEPTPWLKVGDRISTEVEIEDDPDDAVGLDWPPMPLAGTVTELGPDGKYTLAVDGFNSSATEWVFAQFKHLLEGDDEPDTVLPGKSSGM